MIRASWHTSRKQVGFGYQLLTVFPVDRPAL